MHGKPKVIAAGLVVLLLSLVAACGGSGSGDNKSVSLLLTNDPWTRAVKPKISEFEQQTGINVELQVLAQEQALSKLLVTLQSGSPAIDVFQSIPSAVGVQYHQAGFYQGLDKFVEDGELTPADYKPSGFEPGAIEAERIEGDLIGIPILFEGPVVYYRKDLLNRYGLEPPGDLEALMEVARQAYTQSNGEHVTAVRGDARAMVYVFGNFLHNWGVEWADDGRPNFDDPAAVNAAEMYATLAREYGPEGVVNNTYTQSSALMAQGRAVMAIESSNELESVAGEGSSVAESLGVMPLPPGPGGSAPTILTKGISMSAFSENQEASWRFIRWVTSPEMQRRLAEEGVANPRGISGDSAASGSIPQEVYQEWREALQVILRDGNPNVGPPVADQTAAREAIGQAMQQVMLGEADAEEASAQIQSELQGYLEGE